MKGMEFPIVGTKIKGDLGFRYNLSSPVGRRKYFQAKAGDEIKHIGKFLEENTFIAYLLGKKNSGKGTYSKLFAEIFGEDKIVHISVGDLVRDTHANWEHIAQGPELTRLKRLYRGFISFDSAVDNLLGRSTGSLIPSEFILALLKAHIEKFEGKTIFLDGLPRDLDQVSYSLYFRDLVNYREDPDVFVMIDIPESIIDARIKSRVVCPICHTPRNEKLLISSKYGYDPELKKVYLMCDHPSCHNARMVAKEGDNLGIEPIRERLDRDEEILRAVIDLHGVPKVLLRNHVPTTEAKKYFDNYELTPEYVFHHNDLTTKITVEEKPWIVKDDNGFDSYSLLPAPVVVSMLKQLVEALELL